MAPAPLNPPTSIETDRNPGAPAPGLNGSTTADHWTRAQGHVGTVTRTLPQGMAQAHSTIGQLYDALELQRASLVNQSHRLRIGRATTGSTPNVNLHAFVASLLDHRSRLAATNVEALSQFDELWGIDATTKTFTSATQKDMLSFVQLQKQAAYITKHTKKCLWEMREASDHHIGLVILHFFVLDLLGSQTLPAHILAVKTNSDFQKTTVVSHR